MLSKYITYLATKIHYRLEGAGAAVVLIHGFGEDGTIWANQVEFLKEHYLLIIPDLPGSGESEFLKDLDPSKGMESYASAIKAILDDLQIASCVMIGHSMGGYITLAFAELFPGVLQKLGLFHSSAYPDNEQKIETRRKAIAFVQQNGAFAFLKTSIPGLFAEKFKTAHPEVIDAQVEKAKNFSAESVIQYYEAMIARPDRTNIFSWYAKPILFIIGEKDTAIPLQQSLQQCYQPIISVVHLLPEAGHLGMLEEAELSNHILFEFLKLSIR